MKRLFSSQLRRNFMAGPLSAGANVLVLALSYPIYLSSLGYERYGVWLVLATILSFVQLTNLGIGPAVVRLVAEDHHAGRSAEVEKLVTTATYAVLLTGALGFVALLVGRHSIASAFRLTDENRQLVANLTPFVGTLSIYAFAVQILGATLSALGRLDLANYCDSGGRIVGLVVSVGMLRAGMGVPSLLVGSTAALVTNHLASLFFISRLAPYRFMRLRDVEVRKLRRVMGIAGSIMASSAIALALHPFNRFAVARWGGVGAVPVYEIAFSGAMQMRGLAEVGFRAIAPEVSRMTSQASWVLRDRVRHLIGRSLKLIVAGGLPVWIVAALFADVGMRLWLGGRFAEPIPSAFRIMLFGSYMGLLGVPAFYTLLGMGDTKPILVANVLQSMVNVAVVLLVPVDSRMPLQVAAGAAAGMAIANVYLLRVAWVRAAATPDAGGTIV